MSGYVRANGLNVYYDEQGEGEPLILLHGGLTSGRMMWSGHLPVLSRRYRVFVPDSRGHGRTDNPAGKLAYEVMAEDCAAFITAMGLERATVVGYSDGAQIALELGRRHPERVRALVVGGGVAGPTSQYFEDLRGMGFSEPGVVDLDVFAGLFPDFLGTVKQEHQVYGPEYWRELLRQISELWLTVPDYTDDDMASISAPTLVLTGDRDGGTSLEQGLRLYRGIPRSELAVIPNADHAAAVERSLFAELVLEFMSRH